jgi:hypothetical protein
VREYAADVAMLTLEKHHDAGTLEDVHMATVNHFLEELKKDCEAEVRGPDPWVAKSISKATEGSKLRSRRMAACPSDAIGTPIVGRGKTWKEALGAVYAAWSFRVAAMHKDGTPFKFRSQR